MPSSARRSLPCVRSCRVSGSATPASHGDRHDLVVELAGRRARPRPLLAGGAVAGPGARARCRSAWPRSRRSAASASRSPACSASASLRCSMCWFISFCTQEMLSTPPATIDVAFAGDARAARPCAMVCRPRRAEAVDGDAGDGDRQAGAQRDLARDVARRSRLRGWRSPSARPRLRPGRCRRARPRACTTWPPSVAPWVMLKAPFQLLARPVRAVETMTASVHDVVLVECVAIVTMALTSGAAIMVERLARLRPAAPAAAPAPRTRRLRVPRRTAASPARTLYRPTLSA